MFLFYDLIDRDKFNKKVFFKTNLYSMNQRLENNVLSQVTHMLLQIKAWGT